MNVVPTKRTRIVARRMVQEAAEQTPADVALRWAREIDRGQEVALLGLLLASRPAIDPPPQPEPKLPAVLTPRETVDAILEAAAEMFSLPVEHIRSDSRLPIVLNARATVMHAARLAGLSTTVVGALFGRDHSTVINASKRVANRPALLAKAELLAAPHVSEDAA